MYAHSQILDIQIIQKMLGERKEHLTLYSIETVYRLEYVFHCMMCYISLALDGGAIMKPEEAYYSIESKDCTV